MGVGMAAPVSALEIARALIRFPSVTPIDAGALPYLSDLLGRAGFTTELVTFEAPGTPAVLNLYARFGDRSPNLAFAGHTDVVPPGDKALWRFDPFSAEIADGPIFRKVNKAGRTEVRRLSEDGVRQILLRRAAQAGIQGSLAEPISPHGLRAGFVTTAYRNGVPDEEIMGHTRHRSLTTMRSYVRRAKLSQTRPTGKLGL